MILTSFLVVVGEVPRGQGCTWIGRICQSKPMPGGLLDRTDPQVISIRSISATCLLGGAMPEDLNRLIARDLSLRCVSQIALRADPLSSDSSSGSAWSSAICAERCRCVRSSFVALVSGRAGFGSSVMVGVVPLRCCHVGLQLHELQTATRQCRTWCERRM